MLGYSEPESKLITPMRKEQSRLERLEQEVLVISMRHSEVNFTIDFEAGQELKKYGKGEINTLDKDLLDKYMNIFVDIRVRPSRLVEKQILEEVLLRTQFTIIGRANEFQNRWYKSYLNRRGLFYCEFCTEWKSSHGMGSLYEHTIFSQTPEPEEYRVYRYSKMPNNICENCASSHPAIKHCLVCNSLIESKIRDRVISLCKGHEHFKTRLDNVRSQNNRTQVMGLQSDLTIKEWISTIKHFNFSCAYCGGKYEALDHFIPITLHVGTTKNNCVPACKTCNSRKGNRLPEQVFDVVTVNNIRKYLGLNEISQWQTKQLFNLKENE